VNTSRNVATINPAPIATAGYRPSPRAKLTPASRTRRAAGTSRIASRQPLCRFSSHAISPAIHTAFVTIVSPSTPAPAGPEATSTPAINAMSPPTNACAMTRFVTTNAMSACHHRHVTFGLPSGKDGNAGAVAPGGPDAIDESSVRRSGRGGWGMDRFTMDEL
jgi:hypothetical protein